MASSSPSRPPGFPSPWQREASPESISSASPAGKDHVSGLGISSGSSSGAGREVVQPISVALVEGRGRVQDRLTWVQPRASHKSMWCRRKEFLRAQEAAFRLEGSPKEDDLCFNCYRPGHMKWECTNETVCRKGREVGHEAKDCKRPRSPASEVELRALALAKNARRSSPGVVPSWLLRGGPPSPPLPSSLLGAPPSPPLPPPPPPLCSSCLTPRVYLPWKPGRN
jgi:hypothetical protein